MIQAGELASRAKKAKTKAAKTVVEGGQALEPKPKEPKIVKPLETAPTNMGDILIKNWLLVPANRQRNLDIIKAEIQ